MELCGQNILLALPYTLPPIWDEIHLHCHFQCGKPLWSIHTLFSSHCFCSLWFSIWRLPYDVQNPIGYTIGFFLQYIIFIHICLFNACIVSLSIGSYLSMAALTKDVKTELSWINERVRLRANRNKVRKEIFEFIEFHSKAKMLNKWFFCLHFHSKWINRIWFNQMWLFLLFQFGHWFFGHVQKSFYGGVSMEY